MGSPIKGGGSLVIEVSGVTSYKWKEATFSVSEEGVSFGNIDPVYWE